MKTTEVFEVNENDLILESSILNVLYSDRLHAIKQQNGSCILIIVIFSKLFPQ